MNQKEGGTMDIFKWLENRNIKIKDPKLIQNAFVHSSYLNEHRTFENDNERLEYMGDAVLQVWTAKKLFLHEPRLSEGQMTTLRAQLVCETALAQYTRELKLNQFLLLGVGEERTGGRERESIMADMFEAFIGALYLDSGYDVVDGILEEVITPFISAPKGEDLTDYKTKLQEFVQADTRKSVRYEVVNMTGPSNKPEFEVVVMLDEILLGRGKGPSKKKAEQAAAKDAIEKMVQ